MRLNWIYKDFIALVFASAAFAQSNIDLEHRFSWGEGSGWMDWREANGGQDGIVLHDNFLSGFIWSEGSGWIWLGDGTPENGISYANEDGSDFGVNLDFDSGELSGYAWSEGAGWVVFGTTPYVGPDGARFDWDAGRFRGYAYAEGAGWIVLDDDEHYVAATLCAFGDLNCDGFVDVGDVLRVLDGFADPEMFPEADISPCGGDGFIDVGDVLAVLSAFAGENLCP